MIDLHCHILPGIDDGPDSMEGSLALARGAVTDGTTTMVATSHVSWDYPENTASTLAAKVDQVNAVLLEQQVDVEVRPGAEVALTRAIDLPDEELVGLRLGGGPWLLLECPLSPMIARVEEGVEAIRRRGHEHLVLAHPERIPAFQKDPDMLARLIAAGALTSVTAGSFTGRFGKQVQRFTRQLLTDGLVHSVASDAHSAVGRGPQLVTPLRQAGLGDEQIDWLARAVPLAILQGTSLPAAPPMPEERRGVLGRLLGR